MFFFLINNMLHDIISGVECSAGAYKINSFNVTVVFRFKRVRFKQDFIIPKMKEYTVSEGRFCFFLNLALT